MRDLGSLAPLRQAPFRWLLAGGTATALGNAVAPLALAFAVLDLTGSVGDLGLVVGARSAATVVFVLFGGVVADRLPRHLVMVAASLLAAATQAVVAAAVLTGAATVPVLLVLALLNGGAAAFASPASAALLPQTVPPALRQQANAINRLGFNGAMIGGAALGGLLVALAGPGVGLAANAVTYAVAAGCFALVRVVGQPVSDSAGRRVFSDLRDGWSEFSSRIWLWSAVIGFLVINASYAGAVLVLGPAVAEDTIGRGGWGAVVAAQAAGMAVGTVIALHLRVRRLLLFAVLCIPGLLLLIVGLAVAPRIEVLVVAAVSAGASMGLFGVAWETTVQEHVPAEKLARVYAYIVLGGLIAVPIGQVVAGPAALRLGTGPALLAAAGIVALSVAGMLAVRQVRTLEHHPPDRRS